MSPSPSSAKATPKPGKETVYLDVEDDITTIIDKVESARDKVVALVLPKRFSTLQSIVNMRLLKRSADSANKNVVLITNEAALLALAGAAGIHVAKNLQSAPEIPTPPLEIPQDKPTISDDLDADVDSKDAKLDYHRSIGGLASADEAESIPLEDADEDDAAEKPKTKKAPKDKRLRVPNFERFRLLLVAAVLGFIFLIVLIILGIFVWPKATITLQTAATPLSATFDLATSDSAKALDETKNVIPASLKSSDFTSNQQAQATGQQNNGTKATGSATLRTTDCTGKLPSDVPAGTGISTNGLAYITQGSASFAPTVDGNGDCYYTSGSISITAQQGGSKYNTSISGASVAGYPGLTANGSASGGTDNVVTILSQGDVDAAKNKLSDQDKNNFSDNFKKQLDSQQGLYVIVSTLKASDPVINATPAVGQPASTANVSIKITYSVLTIQKSDLKKVLTDNLNKQIDQKKQRIGTNDVLKNVSVTVQNQSSPTVATLTISEDTTAVPIIDTNSIKKQIGGQKSGQIKSLLSSYPGVKNVDVKMSPFWVSKAPKQSNKINIILQQVKSTNPSGG